MVPKDAGLTLIELVMTLAIAGILVVAAVPSFAPLLQWSRTSTAFHLLTTSLATARLRAIKDNIAVTMCPSRDGRTCRQDSIWSDGWILYRDPGRDRQPRSTAAVVQVFDGVARNLRLRSTAGRRRVRFDPAGFAYGSNLTIRLCRGGEDGYLGSVVVNTAGRPRTSRPEAPSDCPFGPPAER